MSTNPPTKKAKAVPPPDPKIDTPETSTPEPAVTHKTPQFANINEANARIAELAKLVETKDLQIKQLQKEAMNFRLQADEGLRLAKEKTDSANATTESRGKKIVEMKLAVYDFQQKIKTIIES